MNKINISLTGKIAEDLIKISKHNKTTVDATIKRMIAQYLYVEKYKKLKEALTPFAEEHGLDVEDVIKTMVEEIKKELKLNRHKKNSNFLT